MDSRPPIGFSHVTRARSLLSWPAELPSMEPSNSDKLDLELDLELPFRLAVMKFSGTSARELIVDPKWLF